MRWTDRTPEDKADIVRRYARQGLSTTQIGNMVGASIGSVAGVARRNHISLRRKTDRRAPTYYKDPVEETHSEKVGFLFRRPDQCAWILGNPSDLLCCGNPIVEEKPYCEDHYHRAYRTGEMA